MNFSRNPLLQGARGTARWALNRVILRLRPRRRVAAGTNGEPFPLAFQFREAMRRAGGPQLLIFGDSVAQRVARDEINSPPLSAMIEAQFEDRTIHSVSFSAYTSHMFEPLLVLAGRLGARPRHVVLPFNLRCLSPQWDSCPMWQYGMDRAIIESLIVDPSGPIPPKIPVPQDEDMYEAVAFSSPLSQYRDVGAFRRIIAGRNEIPLNEEERAREILIYHYGMPARANHRQLLYLRAAVAAASELGAQVHVYLTPVNAHFIEEGGGSELLTIARANAALAASTAEGPRVHFSDWSEQFPPDRFFHPRELTEHLRENGRCELARMLAENIARSENG